jgi:4-hydroxy-tetrahydrodipicolinate reductase
MGPTERVRVVQYGIGPIGLMAIRAILARRDLELVGAIDGDPIKEQRDVADLSGLRRPSGIRVTNKPQDVLAVKRPQVVLHTTQSTLEDVFPQLQHCLESGASVVSTCEELLYPRIRQPKLARELDQLARAKDAVVLGTGINPGFVMDTMAVAASAPCMEVRSVRVERVVDAATRREPIQRKVGAGLTPGQFRGRRTKGEVGHKGLFESLHLVAHGLGWELEKVTERVSPVLSNRTIKTPYLTVKKGQVAGIHHVCRGYHAGKQVAHLDLQMFVGAKKPVDRIAIKGKPEVKLVLEGGVPGDEAAVSMLLNTITGALAARPGLRTMLEIPVPRFKSWC